ncbi:MAG: hypothetical protein CXR30_00175 [Geobacter sp.]|nr:MAG: hypothetical protein CXR30_00175 [Geobacter sp.]
MRNIISTIIMVAFWAITGVASATTWTNIQDPADIFLNAGESTSITHDLSTNGFIKGFDVVNSATLTIDIDNGIYKAKAKITDFDFDAGTYHFNYDDNLLDISLLGLMSFRQDGILDVTITSIAGGFSFNKSTLEASDAMPVPEPATLALLGIGFVALAILSRRRATA